MYTWESLPILEISILVLPLKIFIPHFVAFLVASFTVSTIFPICSSVKLSLKKHVHPDRMVKILNQNEASLIAIMYCCSLVELVLCILYVKS